MWAFGRAVGSNGRTFSGQERKGCAEKRSCALCRAWSAIRGRKRGQDARQSHRNSRANWSFAARSSSIFQLPGPGLPCLHLHLHACELGLYLHACSVLVRTTLTTLGLQHVTHRPLAPPCLAAQATEKLSQVWLGRNGYRLQRKEKRKRKKKVPLSEQ